MDLLISVSTSAAAPVLTPLARACARAGGRFAVFFTHESVLALDNTELLDALQAAETVVVCHDSWQRFQSSCKCPLPHGSQTDHSALIGQCARVMSL